MTGPELVLPRTSASFWLFTEIQYLSGSEFKARMSHVVKDLAGSVGSVPERYVLLTPYRWCLIFPIVLTLLNGFTTCTEAGE